jgi:hypothetical protein
MRIYVARWRRFGGVITRDSRVRDESGFSVVEVVISALILFFVLTAIVGLMGASSNMTVQARQRVALTNVVASYIDELRGYDWNAISTPTGPVTRSTSGVDVVMNYTVETRQQDGQDYIKIIRISASCTVENRTEYYQTTVAIMQNPNFNRALVVDPDAPVVYFETGAPPDDAVLYLTQWLPPEGGSARTIALSTKSFSPTDLIQEVAYDVAGRPLTQQVGGAAAIFTPNPMVQTYYANPAWDTRQEGVLDGLQVVAVTVTDSQLRTGVMRRRFVIDNLAPGNPGVPVGTGLTSSSLRLTWGAARDGGTDAAPFWASQYQYRVSREPWTDGIPVPRSSWSQVAEDSWVAGATPALAVQNAGPVEREAGVTNQSLDAYSRSVPPFSRFTFSVRAASPRGLSTGTFVSAAEPAVTRPELLCDSPSSTYRSTALTTLKGSTPRYNRYTLSLWVSRPAFPYNGTPAYTLQYQSAATTPTATGWLDLVPDATPTVFAGDANADRITAVKTFTGSGAGQRLWFRVGVSGIAPRGEGGGRPLSTDVMWTNAAGTTSVTNGVTEYLQPSWEF